MKDEELSKAITHCLEIAKINERTGHPVDILILAKWLKELQDYRYIDMLKKIVPYLYDQYEILKTVVDSDEYRSIYERGYNVGQYDLIKKLLDIK